nr:sigma-70 family RNA polymerase sigma factor [Lysinibacillus timonensis]
MLISEDELRLLMDQYTELLLRIAYYYVHDLHRSEDIVQDVFIKFYHHQQHYEERGELKAYLSRMTMNKCKDYLKSWSYRKVQFQNKLFSKHDSSVKDDLVRGDEERLIGEAILRLPIKQREPIMYYYFEEMSIKEIASLLIIPESTVKTRLKRGKELLKQELVEVEWEVLLND